MALLPPREVELTDDVAAFCQICNPTQPGSLLPKDLQSQVQHYVSVHEFSDKPAEVLKAEADGSPLHIRLVHQ